jgi:hypothetical protein
MDIDRGMVMDRSTVVMGYKVSIGIEKATHSAVGRLSWGIKKLLVDISVLLFITSFLFCHLKVKTG